MMHYEVHKAAGIILKGGKELLVRAKGKEHFVEPGGKIDIGETAKQALIRELSEELGIEVNEQSLEKFGTFYAPAAGKEELMLRMDVFRVKKYRGEISPQSEIEELIWIGRQVPSSTKVGSIFEHNIHPRLLEEGLIR